MTSLDTNVFVTLWGTNPELNRLAQTRLEQAMALGGLVASAPVCAELLAGPGRTRAFLDYFFSRTGIRADWNIGEAVWAEAGRSYGAFSERRSGGPPPRRILADFVIGAHARLGGHSLLTADHHFFRAAFADLKVVRLL